MKKTLLFAPLLALAACGSADNDPGPGGVSVGEARALDEAAEMIEAKRLPQQSEPAQDPPPADTPEEGGAETGDETEAE